MNDRALRRTSPTPALFGTVLSILGLVVLAAGALPHVATGPALRSLSRSWGDRTGIRRPWCWCGTASKARSGNRRPGPRPSHGCRRRVRPHRLPPHPGLERPTDWPGRHTPESLSAFDLASPGRTRPPPSSTTSPRGARRRGAEAAQQVTSTLTGSPLAGAAPAVAAAEGFVLIAAFKIACAAGASRPGVLGRSAPRAVAHRSARGQRGWPSGSGCSRR